MSGAALANLGARVTVLLLLGALALFALRRASAATRHLVAVTVLATALAMPLLSAALPSLLWPLPTRQAFAADVGAALEARLSRAVVVSAGIWAAVAALLLLRLAVGMARFARLLRRAEDDLPPELAPCRDALRLQRPVRVLRSERAPMPMTAGALEPVILWPADASGWTPERRRLVLLHELGHVKRLDGISTLIAELAAAVWWFHPLVWLLARWSRRIAERATDDLVLGAGEKPSCYAQHLVDLARRHSRSPAVAMPMARPSSLEERLRAVLGQARRGPSSAAGRAAAAGLLAAGLLLSMVRPVAGADPPGQLCAETRARLARAAQKR